MEQPFEVTVLPDGPSVTLCLSGELDIATVGTLRACLESVDDGVGTVVLDLSDLRFLDSSGLALLASLHQQLAPQLRRLDVRGAHGAVQRVLELAGLDQIVPTSGGTKMTSA